jgi:hypothetical protein
MKEWTNSILTLETSFGEGLNQIMDTTFETTEQKVRAIREYLANSLT